MCANVNWKEYAKGLDRLLKGFSRSLDIRLEDERLQEQTREIEKEFRAYFPRSDCRQYDNELHIGDSGDLYRFLLDRGAVGKQIAGYGREFVSYLDEFLEKEGEIIISGHSRMMTGVKGK